MQTLLIALRELGVRAPNPNDLGEWLQPFEELRRAPRDVTIAWYTLTYPVADHVYSSWLDIYVALPPGRPPSAIPGADDRGDGAWMWVAVEPQDTDVDVWTPMSQRFSRALAIEPDVEVWSLEGSLEGITDANVFQRLTVPSCMPGHDYDRGEPIVVSVGEKPPRKAIREFRKLSKGTKLSVEVRDGWSLNAINSALSAWCSELLGRSDLSFQCFDCDTHR